MSNPLFLRISPADNVLVALRDIAPGEILLAGDREVAVQEHIPAKHKIAVGDLHSGDPVYMYGVLVGRATCPVPSGSLISTNNLKHAAEVFGKRRGEYEWQPPDVSRFINRTFMGYHRPDGQVGTRNYWLVIPLVFCENRNILVLKDAFLKELGYAQPDVYRDYLRELSAYYAEHGTTAGFSPELKWNDVSSGRMFSNVDGIKFLTHESGCGETRDDSENLCALLAGYCVNPNVAGVTVLSLGCQHAQIQLFREKLTEKDPDFAKPLLIFERQKWETEYAMLTEAIRQTFAGLVEINQIERKPAGLEHLCVGVKCGGSDGFSGISANPATGHAADMIVALGGKVLMAEYPELCGVEQELIDRCVSDETADNFIHLMREYTQRAEAIGAGFDMNPSPGNIRDGLITDAIKSAGAARKGGSSPVVSAVGYGGYARTGGLHLVCTPGNDVLSTTGMAGAGATIQLFTTGLGTATGNPVSPMVKLSTNHELARKMPDIIDINCGGIITGEKTVEQMGEEILEYIINLANGKFETKATQLGQDDFMFWKRGVSL
jgi:altronate hydrolase